MRAIRLQRLLAAGVLVIPAARASGQRSPLVPVGLTPSASVELGGARLHQSDGLQGNATTLGAQLGLDGARSSLFATVLAAGTVEDAWSLQGVIAASRFAAPGPRLRWEVGALAHLLEQEARGRQTGAALVAREHLQLDAGSLWAGGALGALRDSAHAHALWSIEAGGWHRVGALRLTALATGTATRITTATPRGPEKNAPLSYADALVVAHWGNRALEAEVSGGLRRFVRAPVASIDHDGVEHQLAASVSWWVSPSVALVGATGRQLADPVRGSPAARYATVALHLGWPPRVAPRVAESSSAPRAQLRLDTLGAHLRVLAPRAHQVEVRGTFTDWEPIALERTPDGGWELARILPSGVHRFTMRFDGGAWTAPAGVPTVDDDFGDQVALLTVP